MVVSGKRGDAFDLSGYCTLAKKDTKDSEAAGNTFLGKIKNETNIRPDVGSGKKDGARSHHEPERGRKGGPRPR